MIARFLATACGAGYVPKLPGTAGSAVGLLLGWVVSRLLPVAQFVALGVAFLIGVAASTITERSSGVHDPSFVVIDEVWGMWAVMACLPELFQHGGMIVAAFVIFRAFDIFKPPPLKWLAQAPKGWGIMLDDVGASAYTILLLRVAKWLSG